MTPPDNLSKQLTRRIVKANGPGGVEIVYQDEKPDGDISVAFLFIHRRAFFQQVRIPAILAKPLLANKKNRNLDNLLRI